MHGCVRLCCLLLSVVMSAIFVACAMRSHAASMEFARYFHTDDLTVRLSRLDGISVPVNALLPSGAANATWAELGLPTEHQRWWSLVPSDQGHGEIIPDTKGIGKARYFVWLLALCGA